MTLHPERDSALEAANLALRGRRLEHTATRFASIELGEVTPAVRAPHYSHVLWEVAAVASVGVAALLTVVGVWFV